MTGSPGWSAQDEPTEQLLRRALRTQAAEVGTDSDALSLIRARTRKRTLWHRIRGGAMPFALTTGAASAVAATVTAVVFTVGSCAPPTTTDPSQAPGGPSGSAVPATTAAPGPSSQPPAPSTVANVPIYYIGNIGGKPKLYREFHVLPAGNGGKAGKTQAAITAMLDGRTAYDPDYISSWPASAAVRAVRVDGDTVTIDLSGATVNGYDPPSERAALQQLIWTATAASGTSGMKLLLDGKPVAKLWDLLPASGTLRRGPAVDVLAPVWVIDPQQDAIIGKSTVTINVAGIVFEATMHVRVRNAAGEVVFDRSVNLTMGPPSQGTATVKTPALAPGAYTVEGFYFSAKDGSIQAMDSHTFTVR